ncbi:hypothetical protein FAM09_12295 [Niastella caeni]|uniref:Uncharacterized protein n=1 Tax=Niastella caeni TaxID=2569763 RepID=A0A4V4H169_9BACT|nr:hypothetical protein [Niastella caeni]THU39286.1 hypothetical protein FAM09_12295 [Niastella caeni]
MKILSRSLGFFVAVLALTTVTSCNKLKDVIKINVPLETADIQFSIAPQPAGTQQLTAFQFGINIDSLLKIENSSLGTSNIKQVKVKSITLQLNNATQNDNWGALSACEAGLASNNIPSYTVFAGLTSNPDAYATTLNIPVKDVDLKNYFNSTVLYYKVSGTTRRATTTTLTGTATIVFDIEAGL